jgi:hypothetical protein
MPAAITPGIPIVSVATAILSDVESPECSAEGEGVGNNELDAEENEEYDSSDCEVV